MIFIFQILSTERAGFAATEVTRSIVLGLDKKLLEMATTEVNWLCLPENDNAGANSKASSVNSQIIPPVYASVSGKNKDGTGSKRKNTGKMGDVSSPTSDYHSQNGSVGGNHFSIIEDFVASKEMLLSGLFSILSTVRSRLLRADPFQFIVYFVRFPFKKNERTLNREHLLPCCLPAHLTTLTLFYV